MVSYSQDEGDESPSPKRRAKKKSEKSLKLSNEIVEVVWYHETKMRGNEIPRRKTRVQVYKTRKEILK